MQASTENPRRRALRTIAAVILVAALALTVVSCGAETAVGTTQPDSHALFADALPGIVVDSPTPGATVQSPVRVTGSVQGGAAVSVTLTIVSADGSVVAKSEEAFYDTGARLTLNQTLQYAPASAGRAARIVITATVAPVGGQPATYTNVVPITLQ